MFYWTVQLSYFRPAAVSLDVVLALVGEFQWPLREMHADPTGQVVGQGTQTYSVVNKANNRSLNES